MKKVKPAKTRFATNKEIAKALEKGVIEIIPLKVKFIYPNLTPLTKPRRKKSMKTLRLAAKEGK